MRIYRYHAAPVRRSSRRRSGCLSLVILLGVLIGFVLSTWGRLGELFNVVETNQAESGLRAAQRAFDRGDLDAAVDLARQTWREEAENTAALILLVRALIYRSYSDYNHDLDRKAALQLTSAAFERSPRDADILAAHAFALHANNDPIRAAQYAERALSYNPDHVLARVTLALAYGGVGGYENALKESQRAVALAGEYALDVQRALAISYSDLGRYREAIRAVDGAITYNNKLALLHFERALYGILAGDTDIATASYFSVLAFDPENVKARLRMCELSSLLRESDRALQYCTAVTTRAPGWVDGWHQLGREYYLLGQFESAQEALNRCTSLAVAQDIPILERPFECWYLQGQAAEILGDCEALLKVYGEFQQMAAAADLPQTWVYPPEGPTICLNS
jgi:tetratricopeptide (TPR) repeat protein